MLVVVVVEKRGCLLPAVGSANLGCLVVLPVQVPPLQAAHQALVDLAGTVVVGRVLSGRFATVADNTGLHDLALGLIL